VSRDRATAIVLCLAGLALAALVLRVWRLL
jgi:hypothetical protein